MTGNKSVFEYATKKTQYISVESKHRYASKER